MVLLVLYSYSNGKELLPRAIRTSFITNEAIVKISWYISF